MSLLIFVIGRPGAGKSAFIKTLSSLIANFDHELNLNVIDELELLYEIESDLTDDEVEKTDKGHIVVKDRFVFSKTMKILTTKALENLKTKDIIFCEFSRSSYRSVLRRLASNFHSNYMIIYLDSPISTCLERNENRISQSDNKYIPKEIIEKYYESDDLDDLKSEFKKNIYVIENSTEGVESLEKSAKSFVKKSLVPYLKSNISYHKKSVIGEIAIAALLILYLCL